MEFYLSLLFAFFAALAWGMNAILIRLGMKGENHFHGLFIRSLFAFPILFGIVLIWKGTRGISVYFADPIIYYSLTSASLVLIGDSLFLIGLKHYSVNTITPISASYPLFTAITLILTGEENVGIFVIIGTIIVISGVAIVTSNDLTKTFDRKALGIGLLTAACWGISIYFVRLVLERPGTDALGLTGLRMMVIGLTAILIYRVGTHQKIIEDTTSTRHRNSWKYMAASGFIGWVFGASFFFAAVQQIGAAIPTPISSTNPIIASIIAQLLGIDQLNFRQFLGILVTVLGVIVIVSF